MYREWVPRRQLLTWVAELVRHLAPRHRQTTATPRAWRRLFHRRDRLTAIIVRSYCSFLRRDDRHWARCLVFLLMPFSLHCATAIRVCFRSTTHHLRRGNQLTTKRTRHRSRFRRVTTLHH